MSDSQTPRFVPLGIRRVVLRVIVISSLSSFLTGVIGIYGRLDIRYGTMMYLDIRLFISIVPLSVFVHHILRLWPRKIWSVRSDFIYSTIEFIIVTGYTIVEIVFGAWASPIEIAARILLWLSLCASSVFAIWDHRVSRYRTMGYTYDFMENGARPMGRLNPQHGRWFLLFGENVLKRRFGMDPRLIRGLRALLAILCLLAMITLGYFVLVIQPITPQLYFQTSQIDFTAVGFGKSENVTVQARLEIEVVRPSGTLPTRPYDLNITWRPENIHDCQYDYTEYQVACTVHSPFFPNAPFSPDDFTITVNYTRALQHVSASSLRTGVYLNFDTRQEDAWNIIDSRGNARATRLYPGLHLFGTTFYSYKDTYASSRDRFFGIPRFNRRLVGNVQDLIPDPEYIPSNSDNNTATLRLTYRGGQVMQTLYNIEREQSGNTVLSGFALLGGAWTFINGLFATVFGCTLLLVLFGIKPLSIYGLVHLFQRRRSLADGGYTLSGEDQTQTIALLREHLLDSNSDIETSTALEKSNEDEEQRGAGDTA